MVLNLDIENPYVWSVKSSFIKSKGVLIENNEDVKNGSWKILKNSVIRVSIDQEFLSIDRMFFSIDRRGIEDRSIQAETPWWNSSLSQSIENSFQPIECWFQSIEQESGINQTRQNLYDEFLHFSIDRVIGSIDRRHWILNFHLFLTKC